MNYSALPCSAIPAPQSMTPQPQTNSAHVKLLKQLHAFSATYVKKTTKKTTLKLVNHLTSTTEKSNVT